MITDEQNILRLRCRFGNSIFSYNEKYPIILRDGQHSYSTVLIIRDAHERVMHHGIETTLSCVRAKLCFVNEKKFSMMFFLSVFFCKKISRIAILPPPTSGLSDYRVNVSMFLFQAVGLDFAGPSL